jgi:hypothetical protein
MVQSAAMTQWVFLVVAVAAAGCPRTGSPIASAPPPACITPPDEAAEITHAVGDAARVQFCVGAAAEHCFALDLASGALAALDKPPRERAGVETTVAETKVCAGADCKTLAAQPWQGPRHSRVAASGPIEVVLLGDAVAGKGYTEVWDMTASNKLATFHYAHGDFRCGDVALLGHTIYISANACTAPTGRGTLYALDGKKLANVGDKDFGTFGNALVEVDGAEWAFVDENATRLVIQDVATGRVKKTIDVTALWRRGGAGSADSAPIGNPGESAIVKLDAARLAVIGGTPANGSVAIVDVATGAVKVVRAPLCH